MAEGGELRQKSFIQCQVLANAMKAMLMCKCELEKANSELDAVQKVGQCTVQLRNQFPFEDFSKLSEEVKRLLETVSLGVKEHAEEHPAGKSRDSGFHSIHGVENLEDANVAMAERLFVELNCINDEPYQAIAEPAGETHC